MFRHWIALVAFGAALAAASAAHATFPGGVGRIALPMGGENVDIYTVSADGTGEQQLTTAPGFDGCPAYSRSGKQIAFCSDRTGRYQIWAMNADGTGQRQVTKARFPALFPAYSPDGRRIVFDTSDGSPAGQDIYAVSAAGGKPKRLTGAPGDDVYPAVSPDGKTIAFVSHRKQNVGQIWLMDVAGGKHQRALTHDAPAKDEVPDWSPDGKRIAYQAGTDIWVMNADGREQRNLTRGRGGFAFGPRWSPDGAKIAFVRRAGPLKQVYVMNADGTGLRPLWHTSARQLVPAWQPVS